MSKEALSADAYLTAVDRLYRRFLGLTIDDCPDFSSLSQEERVEKAKTLSNEGVKPTSLVNEHANDCDLDRVDEDALRWGGEWVDLEDRHLKDVLKET